MDTGIIIQKETGGVRRLPVAYQPGYTCLGHLYLQRDVKGRITPEVAFGAFVKVVQGYLKHLDGKRGGYSLESLRTEKDVIDVISTLTGSVTNRTMVLQLTVLGRRSNKLPQKPVGYWRKIVGDLMPELE